MEVVDALRAAAEVFAGKPVTFAYLFGSHATGTARPDSDVDVAVHVDDRVSEDAYLRLSIDFAGELALRSGVGPIDGVVVLNEAPLRLVGPVLSQGRVIYSRDEPARVRYEVRVRALALDSNCGRARWIDNYWPGWQQVTGDGRPTATALAARTPRR